MEIVKKTLGHRLVKGLTLSELRCPCCYEECRSTIYSLKMVRAFGIFRFLVGVACYIQSGFRCTRYNNFVEGSPTSKHLLGMAIDIASINLLEKFSMDEILNFAKLSGFTYYIYYEDKNIFHFDVREHGGNL